MIEPWEKIESTHRGEYAVFKVREDRSRSPETGKVHPFYVIEADDWVNVIPLTPEGRIVFIEQYRHATETVTLEVPGGTVDPEDPSPEHAARRELNEETGYDTGRLVYLGAVEPNPAILNNRCHTFLALDVRPAGPQRLDGAEEIDVLCVDPEDVPGLVTSGRITHALVVTAFYLYERYRSMHGDDGARDA